MEGSRSKRFSHPASGESSIPAKIFISTCALTLGVVAYRSLAGHSHDTVEAKRAAAAEEAVRQHRQQQEKDAWGPITTAIGRLITGQIEMTYEEKVRECHAIAKQQTSRTGSWHNCWPEFEGKGEVSRYFGGTLQRCICRVELS